MKFLSTIREKKAGFTLIELLIVMVIIAVLATLGFVSYQNALRNTRNAKAIGDMKALQAALEQAYTANGGTYLNGGNCDTRSLESTLTQPQGVTYTGPVCTTTEYCACAQLVSGSSTTMGNRSGGAGAVSSCDTLNSTGTHFCVRERQ